MRWKWDYFLNLDALEFLNYLAFVKDKQAEEARIAEEQNRQLKYSG